ncbi:MULTISPECIES: hypothetical protein [Rahnella]|jgi:hypothetical protein|uniref:Lipoprotein n=1 Tax=Rahnella contaminans TaxID=2703882 RepID=A0A6M2B437_9GAMM|nr:MULTISPECIES: hypothetical protein [Rahnella]KAB8308058.1 hypothetical protein EH227_15700 [Rouxiella chamberiensis]MBU9818652.1 hypothetical protein [Rahnella sp. BCC 1045]MCS3422212.1 hypothetical protein [Rahnella sp. BIGb0603]MDF1893113.1 hypothetical protein [Rahnella contaminans]NGX87976.1 hypothetical protein [Rahnella contaminans]
MKNIKIMMVAAVAAATLLAGCSSIDEPVGAEVYRPANFDASFVQGQASYESSVFSILERQRRADTYKKIFDFCTGKFQTLGESNDGDRVHIRFACLPKPATQSTYSNQNTYSIQQKSPSLY